MDAKDLYEIACSSLRKAVKYDNEAKYTESLPWYEEGLSLLLVIMKIPGYDKLLPGIKQKTMDFMSRAEKLKDIIDKENSLDKLKLNPGQHQQIKIDKDSTGHSYESIFNRFLVKGDANEVCVEDPYIRDSHQVSNFVRFCEVMAKSQSPIKRISLVTGFDKNDHHEQKNSLDSLARNLQTRGISLTVTYSNNLHDREIRFDNGWIVKIGRGLDYFKRLPHSAVLGVHDFDFRACLETTVDIFHRKAIAGDS